MLDKTLFKSFNDKNTTTENKRQRTQIPKKKKKIGNNILVGYSLLDTKMDNYKEQYTNKKGDKELKLKWLRTFFHVGYTGHIPTR